MSDRQPQATCPKCHFTSWAGAMGTHIKWCLKREAHFWSKVDKNGAGGCWLYNGTISFEGYGYVNIGMGVRRKQWQAHRFAWSLLKGELAPGICVLHICDVRHCVNPDHLYLGDRIDNNRDKIRRNRDTTATISAEHVAEVKAALLNYRHGMCSALARKYGVSPEVISAIKTGKNFRHIEAKSPAAGESAAPQQEKP